MNPTRTASSRGHRSPTPPPLPTTGFKAFIAYADLDAARQAMATINEVLVASSHPYRLEPMLWRFDQVIAAKWHEPALADAVHAHVVVLARSAPGALPSGIDQWVTDFLARKKEARTTLVALLGTDDAWTISIEGTAAHRSHAVAPTASFAPLAPLATRAA